MYGYTAGAAAFPPLDVRDTRARCPLSGQTTPRRVYATTLYSMSYSMSYDLLFGAMFGAMIYSTVYFDLQYSVDVLNEYCVEEQEVLLHWSLRLLISGNDTRFFIYAITLPP